MSPGHTNALAGGPPLTSKTGAVACSIALVLAGRAQEPAWPERVMLTSCANPGPGFWQVAVTTDPGATAQQKQYKKQRGSGIVTYTSFGTRTGPHSEHVHGDACMLLYAHESKGSLQESSMLRSTAQAVPCVALMHRAPGVGTAHASCVAPEVPVTASATLPGRLLSTLNETVTFGWSGQTVTVPKVLMIRLAGRTVVVVLYHRGLREALLQSRAR